MKLYIGLDCSTCIFLVLYIYMYMYYIFVLCVYMIEHTSTCTPHTTCILCCNSTLLFISLLSTLLHSSLIFFHPYLPFNTFYYSLLFFLQKIQQILHLLKVQWLLFYKLMYKVNYSYCRVCRFVYIIYMYMYMLGFHLENW